MLPRNKRVIMLLDKYVIMYDFINYDDTFVIVNKMLQIVSFAIFLYVTVILRFK